MVEFIRAALPWVVMGVVIAIFAVQYSNRKKSKAKALEETDNKKEENYMSEGMCIGLCLGVCISSAGLWDMSMGICIGLFAGLLIGMCVKK